MEVSTLESRAKIFGEYVVAVSLIIAAIMAGTFVIVGAGWVLAWFLHLVAGNGGC